MQQAGGGSKRGGSFTAVIARVVVAFTRSPFLERKESRSVVTPEASGFGVTRTVRSPKAPERKVARSGSAGATSQVRLAVTSPPAYAARSQATGSWSSVRLRPGSGAIVKAEVPIVSVTVTERGPCMAVTAKGPGVAGGRRRRGAAVCVHPSHNGTNGVQDQVVVVGATGLSSASHAESRKSTRLPGGYVPPSGPRPRRAMAPGRTPTATLSTSVPFEFRAVTVCVPPAAAR